MIHYKTDKYRIDIYDDQTFIEGSFDNLTQYDFVYFDRSEYHFPSVYGIKVYLDDTLIKSAAIGSIGSGTTIHDTSTIIENDRLLVCCSDTIFCLSIPDLTLLWRTQADQATCFEIYKHQDVYRPLLKLPQQCLRLHGDFMLLGPDQQTSAKSKASLMDAFASVAIYIQKDSPGKDKESNWLIAPSNDNAYIVLRCYWPKEAILNGSWKAPQMVKVN